MRGVSGLISGMGKCATLSPLLTNVRIRPNVGHNQNGLPIPKADILKRGSNLRRRVHWVGAALVSKQTENGPPLTHYCAVSGCMAAVCAMFGMKQAIDVVAVHFALHQGCR